MERGDAYGAMRARVREWKREVGATTDHIAAQVGSRVLIGDADTVDWLDEATRDKHTAVTRGYAGEWLPLVRRDKLAEELEYVDTGCDLARSCLACPFSQCRYDAPCGTQSQRRQDRKAQVAELVGQGRTVLQIMAITGISQRQTYRYLREVRG